MTAVRAGGSLEPSGPCTRTIARGDAESAWSIYTQTLGGYDRLGGELGQYELGERIISLFCHDRSPTRSRPALPLRRNWLVDWGQFAEQLGDLDLAWRCYETLLEYETDAGDLTEPQLSLAEVWRTTMRLAWVALHRGRLPAAREYAERGLGLATTSMQREEAHVLLALASSWSGDRAEAEAHLAEAEPEGERYFDPDGDRSLLVQGLGSGGSRHVTRAGVA